MLREYTAEDPSAPNQLETSGPAASGDDLSDGSIANVLAHYGAAAGGAESDDDSNDVLKTEQALGAMTAGGGDLTAGAGDTSLGASEAGASEAGASLLSPFAP